MTTGTATAPPKADAEQGEIRKIALGDLREAKYNPRQYFDETALKNLADSIKSKGILNPLLVRPIGDHYEIMGGARRFRAAKAAGLKEVPAIVRLLSDVEALEVAVIDNLQRKDVHPLEEAEGFAALLKQDGYDVAAIALKTGMSQSHVYQRLKFADLIEPLKKAFAAYDIQAGHAILLARLSPADQQTLLDRALFDRHYDHNTGRDVKTLTPVRQLAHVIGTKIHRNLDAAPWKKDDAELLPKAGPCTTCPFRAGNQPELFADVERKDKVCTKPVCYDAKLEAFGQRKFDQVRKDDKKAVKISEEYSGGPKDALAQNAYSILSQKQKDCPNTRSGVFVDGEKIGRTARICAGSRECKVHNHYHSGGAPSPAAKAARARELAQERKRKLEIAARRRVVKAIYEKVEKLTREDLLLVAERFEADVWYERRKFLAELVGAHGSNGNLRKQLTALDDKRLLGFILACAISQEVMSHHGGTQSLAKVAKRHGVNAKKAGQEPPKPEPKAAKK